PGQVDHVDRHVEAEDEAPQHRGQPDTGQQRAELVARAEPSTQPAQQRGAEEKRDRGGADERHRRPEEHPHARHAIVKLRMGQRRLFYGWVVVGASATIVCIGMGALFSLGVFLKPMADAMGWSRGAISSVALLNWIAMGLGSFVWGTLSDRIGTRGVAVAGGFLLGLGLVLSGRGQSLREVVVEVGFLV